MIKGIKAIFPLRYGYSFWVTSKINCRWQTAGHLLLSAKDDPSATQEALSDTGVGALQGSQL
jgi:hypothetical protein